MYNKNMHQNRPPFLSGILESEAVISGLSTRLGNLDRLVSGLGTDGYPNVIMNQVHGNDFHEVTPLDVAGPKNIEINNVDALFTKEKGIGISVKSADCLPILIYHPMKMIGVIHAGRKSTELNILPRVLGAIKKTYKISNGFKIWFGPCICASCYQIDKEKDLHYDLISENKKQLKDILTQSSYQLDSFSACTACRNDLFFSYRKEGKFSGRLYSYIFLK
jgi:polyphenol oxidase